MAFSDKISSPQFLGYLFPQGDAKPFIGMIGDTETPPAVET